jgi:hypothetical protein
MEPIHSLDEPDPVQRYLRRQAIVRRLVLGALGAVLVIAAYWEFYR